MSENFSELITNTSHKLHLNLSNFAWNVIENDRFNFSADPSCPIEFARFLNTIFLNCYNSASFSIFPSNLTEQISSEYNKLLNDISRNLSTCPKGISKEILAQCYLGIYIDRLKERAHSYPKGIGKKFRLNNEAYDIICTFTKDSYESQIFQKPGKYLKAVFEEYVLLPYSQRETIFFRDIIKEIKSALRQECTLQITTGSDMFEVIPYKIETDALATYLYLAGASCPYSANPGNSSFKHVSFRISRIKKIKCNTYVHKKLSPEEAELFDTQILERGIQFLLTDTMKIGVRLTDEGIYKYRTQLHLRPAYINIVQNNIYEFQATPMQIEAYFFKFGKAAEIVYPDELRSIFRNKYKEALETYQ